METATSDTTNDDKVGIMTALRFQWPADGLISDKANAGLVTVKSGGRLNKKDGLTRYDDSHVKDKTS